MSASLPILHDNLRIASPCDKDWADMQGDDQRRFCDACQKNVYNLSVMSPEALVMLIEQTEGKFCGRLYKRPDGTVLTEDCPVGMERLRRAARRTKRLAWAAAAMALSMVGAGLSMLSRDPERPAKVVIEKTQKKIEKKIEPPEEFLMGDVYVEPER